MSHGRILLITDKFGISAGYEPAFNKLVASSKIPRSAIIKTSPYATITELLKKYRNEHTLRYNPEKAGAIKTWVDNKIQQLRPTMIVCTDPATLGLFTGWDLVGSTLSKCRGGYYEYAGLPVLVTLPITAMHRHVDERVTRTLQVAEDLGDDDVVGGDAYQPYKVQSGMWILAQDWLKIGRWFNGKQLKLPQFQYSICRTVEDCQAAVDWLSDCKAIADDIETGLFPAQITCIGYTGIKPNGRVRSFVIPFYDDNQMDGCFWARPEDHEFAWECTREINNNQAIKIQQNGNYDSSYFIRDGLGLHNYLIDTMLAWYSCFMELPKSLDFISSILIDTYTYWKDDIKGIDQKDEIGAMGQEKYWRYCALDTYYTLFNGIRLMGLIRKNPSLRANYNDTFYRAKSALAMSMRGIKADKNRLAEHRVALQEEAKTNLARFRYLIDEPEFNVNSPDQKLHLMYEVLGAVPRNAKGRVVKGKDSPSSGANAIKQVRSDHPLFNIILGAMTDASTPLKQMSNVTGRWDEAEGRVTGGIKMFTDRVRTSYNPAGTETTRFSSRGSVFWDGTNLQNLRDTYRDFMVADPGCILIDVDYSQSDDVFMGYESGDQAKIEVIESGKDGHAIHGELFFKMPYDEIVRGKKAGDPAIVHPIYGIRQISKKIVHGSNFIMTPGTLYAVLMGKEATVASMKYMGFADAHLWTPEKLVNGCQMLMNAYRHKYPRLSDKGYYKDLREALRLRGELTNAFGVTRKFLGDPSDSGTLREAAAMMGQSGTAGNMNRVMYEIDSGYIQPNFRDGPNPSYGDTPRRMDIESHGFRFLLQTHDSFTAQLNLRHPRIWEAVDNLLYVMSRPIIIHGRQFFVRTEAALGLRWGKKMISYVHGKDSLDDVIARALIETK